MVNQLIDRIGRRGGGGGEEGREGERKGERHMAGVVEWLGGKREQERPENAHGRTM